MRGRKDWRLIDFFFFNRNPFESIGIMDGVIECLGTNQEVSDCLSGAEANVIDLQNKVRILHRPWKCPACGPHAARQ